MNKLIFASMAVAGLAVAPTVASAQDAAPFVGLSVGHHDLGVDDDTFDIDDSGIILGVVAGVDVPVGDTLFAGIEGNYHFGLDAIDNEFGISGRLGVQSANGAKYYVRGGYQEVDLDLEAVLDTELPEGLEDSEGDYLLGLGLELPVGNAAFRANVDTIAFDSLRLTTGVVFSF